MGAGGRDWSYFAVRIRRLFGEHANYYRRDVVVAAIDVRFLNQRIDDSLGLGTREEELLDPAVVNHSRQPIAGEKECITDMGIAVENVGIDLVGHADATGDDVALGVASRLLGSQQPGIDLLLHE